MLSCLPNIQKRLSEQGINVLTLYRGSKVIPNPQSSRIIEADDKLRCYGKLEFMRGMAPEKTRGRRQPEIQESVFASGG